MRAASLSGDHRRWQLAPLAWVGIALLVVLGAAALFAPLLAPFDPAARSGIPFSPPGEGHLLGTNDVGHDILSELLFGARVSLLVGLAAALAATGVGGTVGLAAGYVGGWVDAALMRLVDVTLALPFLPLAIVLGVFFGGGIVTQIAVIAGVAWAVPARELRSQVLSARRRADVEAAVVMGASRSYLLRRHLLPAVAPLLAPQLVRAATLAILTEASLSFLGLGDAGTKSWGTMLYYAQARGALLTDAWRWWVLPPGLGIAATVVALAFLGYAIEERAQPRLRVRRGRRPRPALGPARVDETQSQALDVRDLAVEYDGVVGAVPALSGVSLGVERGEVVGVVGRSGSGKSTLASVVLGLLHPPGRIVAGSVAVAGNDLASLGPGDLRHLRGRVVSLVPQDAMGALNPVVRVGGQLAEAVRLHERVGRRAAAARARALLEVVGIPPDRDRAFPHEMSGGMRQRVVLAMALVHRPALLVADEPTTGLDPVVRNELLELVERLRRDLGLAVLLISHDLAAVLRLADRLVVLDGGEVVEEGPARTIAALPSHAATRHLVAASRQVLASAAHTPRTAPGDPPVLELEGVSKTFRSGRRSVAAAEAVSLRIAVGEAVGLVGRSGAGKSTLARLVCGLLSPEAGHVHVEGKDPASRRGRTQLVFQDPYEALPPALRVVDVVAEPLLIAGACSPRERRERAREALDEVALDPERFAERFPHELSGGERQRVALARAIVARPALVVADEPAAMLDATLAAELVELVAALRSRYGMAWLLITHELGLAARVCDRLVVLADGKVVDEGPTARVLSAPDGPEARVLVAAAQELAVGV